MNYWIKEKNSSYFIKTKWCLYSCPFLKVTGGKRARKKKRKKQIQRKTDNTVTPCMFHRCVCNF